MTLHFHECAAIVRGKVAEAVSFRANSLVLGASILVQIVLLNGVWTAAYRSTEATPAQPLDSLLVYITLASLHSWLMFDSVLGYLQRRVEMGTVVFDLVRPVGFLRQMAAHQLGYSAGALLFLLPAVPLAWAVGSLTLPTSAAAAAAYSLSLGLALAVHVLLSLLVGLSAFWTIQITGATLLYRVVGQFLAGGFAPLGMFPNWLAKVAELLPFQATTYTPVAVYTGALSGHDALAAVGVQLLWVLVLAAVLRTVWRIAVRRVVVQGG